MLEKHDNNSPQPRINNSEELEVSIMERLSKVIPTQEITKSQLVQALDEYCFLHQ